MGKARVTAVRFLATLIFAAAIMMTVSASAYAVDYTISTPTGSDCNLFGSWNAASSTCTMNRDMTGDTITINSDSVKLDGDGHSITGTTGFGNGVTLSLRSGVVVRNVRFFGFNNAVNVVSGGANFIQGNEFSLSSRGVSISGSPNNIVRNNKILSVPGTGILIEASNTNTVAGNTMIGNAWAVSFFSGSSGNSVFRNTIIGNSVSPANTGIYLNSSSNNSIWENNFTKLATPVDITGSSSGNMFNAPFSGNYWDTFSSPASGCANVDANLTCDGRYSTLAFEDLYPYVLPNAWSRYDWTWYDDIYGDNWVLMGNTTGAAGEAWFNLNIAGTKMAVDPLPGFAAEQVPVGRTVYMKYPGLMNGPVTATITTGGSGIITSQRILWPKGGDSLDEIAGSRSDKLSNEFYWPYYNMTGDFQDWLLIANPGGFQIDYEVIIGGQLKDSGVLQPNERKYLTFPAFKGGPVRVKAKEHGNANPAFIFSSQRVLSNGGNSFNEMVGTPVTKLSGHYVWTWYDQQSPGVTDEIAIGNITTSSIWYRVRLGTDPNPVATGTVGPNATAFVTMPGVMGGPLHVETFLDAGFTTSTQSVVSQRTIWGPSFEEVAGFGFGSLSTNYNWTWYDQQSPGAFNWVMVTNPNNSAVSYTLKINGVVKANNISLPAGESDELAYPGLMEGPVEVTSSGGNVLSSQRVLWKGHFNELVGAQIN